MQLGGGEEGVDTAGGDGGAKKSSDLTGVEAPLSNIHTHVCTQNWNSAAQKHTISITFLPSNCPECLHRNKFIICATLALLRNVFMKHPKRALPPSSRGSYQPVNMGTLLNRSPLSPFLFL